jgi:hypothetical protein
LLGRTCHLNNAFIYVKFVVYNLKNIPLSSTF